MPKIINDVIDEKFTKRSDTFARNIDSNMKFDSQLSSESMTFDWVDEIEYACKYLDNIVRAPKLTLVSDENVVKIEKAKMITVASVKDLSRHTHFIEKINKKTQEVQPSKILDVRSEETFNTYENRFVYTLLLNLMKFMTIKEALLEDFEIKNKKTLEYKGTTLTDGERVTIELKINSSELPKDTNDSNFEKEIDEVRKRVAKIKQYINSWVKSEFFKSMVKNRALLVQPPIKKNNVILKNPNFQIAMKLWDFLQTYDGKNSDKKNGLDNNGDNTLKSILDNSFLTDYFVLDSMVSSKRLQKEKLSKYAVLMINRQIQNAVSILLNNGIKITDEEILNMVANEIKNEKNKNTLGSADVKNKFKSAMDDYLDKIQDYM